MSSRYKTKKEMIETGEARQMMELAPEIQITAERNMTPTCWKIPLARSSSIRPSSLSPSCSAMPSTASIAMNTCVSELKTSISFATDGWSSSAKACKTRDRYFSCTISQRNWTNLGSYPTRRAGTWRVHRNAGVVKRRNWMNNVTNMSTRQATIFTRASQMRKKGGGGGYMKPARHSTFERNDMITLPPLLSRPVRPRAYHPSMHP